jgi:hypothetical protein
MGLPGFACNARRAGHDATQRESDQCRYQVARIGEVATDDDRCCEPEQERRDSGTARTSGR